jgi:hypothetical protein
MVNHLHHLGIKFLKKQRGESHRAIKLHGQNCILLLYPRRFHTGEAIRLAPLLGRSTQSLPSVFEVPS